MLAMQVWRGWHARDSTSITDQVAESLRQESLRQALMEGRWRGTLPGRNQLARDLGCSQWTVEEATQRLALRARDSHLLRRFKMTGHLSAVWLITLAMASRSARQFAAAL